MGILSYVADSRCYNQEKLCDWERLKNLQYFGKIKWELEYCLSIIVHIHQLKTAIKKNGISKHIFLIKVVNREKRHFYACANVRAINYKLQTTQKHIQQTVR